MQEQEKTTGNDDRKGKLPETREDIPHGHGAHVNEKEANAQEEYPGPKDEEEKNTDRNKS